MSELLKGVIEKISFDFVDTAQGFTQDQKKSLRLYASTLIDAVDGNLPRLDNTQMYELSDDIRYQTNAVLKNPEDGVIAFISYDAHRSHGAFIESIAVDPSARHAKIGRKMLGYAIEQLAGTGFSTVTFRSQPTSLPVNERMIASLGHQIETDFDGTYPKSTVYFSK